MREQWTLRDVVPMVLDHFGLALSLDAAGSVSRETVRCRPIGSLAAGGRAHEPACSRETVDSLRTRESARWIASRAPRTVDARQGVSRETVRDVELRRRARGRVAARAVRVSRETRVRACACSAGARAGSRETGPSRRARERSRLTSALVPSRRRRARSRGGRRRRSRSRGAAVPPLRPGAAAPRDQRARLLPSAPTSRRRATADGHRGDAHRARQPRCARARGEHRPAYARAYLSGPGPLAGLVLRAAASGRTDAQRGDRAGHRRRPQRTRARDVDRAAGRLDDGARDPGAVRPRGQRSVGLDRAVRALRRAVRAPAAADAAPRPRRAARVLRLVRVLRRRRTSTSRCRRPIRCSRYLLGRMLWIGFRRPAEHPEPRPARRARRGSCCSALVFLVGFRLVLNVTNGNVIDVGYAGRHRRRPAAARRRALRRRSRRQRSSATPTGRRLRAPTRRSCSLFGWGGTLGRPARRARRRRRLRPRLPRRDVARRPPARRAPRSGLLLAYLWAACPFTLLVANSGANDALVAALVLAAFLCLDRPAARGALAIARGADEVRAARARAAVRRASAAVAARSLAAAADRRRAGPRARRARARRARAVLGPHARLPGRARLAVLRLGPLRRPRRAPGRGHRRRGRAGGRRRVRAPRARRGHRRGARRGGADRAPARGHALVLPLPRLVPAAAAHRAARRDRRHGSRTQHRLDRRRAAPSGRSG